MKALDTNVLVRFLVNDDRVQGERVRQLLREAEMEGDSFLITVPVVVELIWVLSSVYGVPRGPVLEAVDRLTLMPVLEFEQADRIREWVIQGRKEEIDLADILIGVFGRAAGATATLTFDQKATRSVLFQSL